MHLTCFLIEIKYNEAVHGGIFMENNKQMALVDAVKALYDMNRELFVMYTQPVSDLGQGEERLDELNQMLARIQWSIFAQEFVELGNLDQQLEDVKAFYNEFAKELMEEDGVDLQFDTVEDTVWCINLAILTAAEEIGKVRFIYGAIQSSQQEQSCSCHGGCGGGCGCGA